MKNSAFQDQKMSKSANAKVKEELTRDFHQVQAQNIQRICAAMDVLV